VSQAGEAGAERAEGEAEANSGIGDVDGNEMRTLIPSQDLT